jgi:pimeloyl-ACP methyl ester carboxylesterase
MDLDYVVLPAILLAIAIVVTWLAVERLRSLSAKPYGLWRKLTERIVLSFSVLLAVALAGNSLFNTIAMHRFWALNTRPGDIHTVNGHKMHIFCTGSGSPVILLDEGLGSDSLVWSGVQPVLSKTTRVCSYDRAGFGWSDAAPDLRDADHISGELHQLLLQAGITGNIVLMGHSIAGIYVRDYAARYPADVVGIVFVDGSTPFQDKNPAMKGGGGGPPPWLVKLALSAGVPRLSGMCSWGAPGVDIHTRKLQGEANCRVHFSAISAEMKNIDRSSQEAVQSASYSGLPILIISHDPTKQRSSHPTEQDVNAQNAWSQMQEDLKKLSTRSRRIIARGSGHNIMFDRPDLINKEVPWFIDQVRGTAPQPTNYGSTITE